MGAQARRLMIAAAGTAALLAAAGCGGEDDFANEPRPPSPVVVTARIGPDRVDVAPRSLGAGPIELIVTNQTTAAQRITLSGQDPGSGLRQQTPPINPSSTASLKIDVRQGDYRLSVERDGIRAARLRVGERRPSAQNQLLQP